MITAEPSAEELATLLPEPPAGQTIVRSVPRGDANHDIHVPPSHPDSEDYLIAGMVLDDMARAEAIRRVMPSQFYNPMNSAVCRIVYRMDNEARLSGNATENTNVILTAIDESGIFDDVTGGFNEFSSQWITIPHFDYVDYHAGRVSNAAILREAIQQSQDTIRAAREGESAELIIERMNSNAATIRERLQVRGNLYRTLTSAELDAAEFRMEYLVENALVAGQPGVLAGVKKVLKTNIGIDLTASLASGDRFLGKFYVPRAVRVGLMSGESGDMTIQETARRICRSKQWKNLSDYENAVWSFDLPRLGQPQTKRDLIKFIQDHSLEVLIIDPAYLCLDLGDGAGNVFSVGPKLFDLTEVGHLTGCTLIIVHHCKKRANDQFAAPELEDIAWSGFQEWARQWILIGRREPYDPENTGSHKLWLNVGGSAGHSGLWGGDIEEGSRSDQGGRRWEVSIDGASKVVAENISERETVKEQQARQKIDKQLAADAEKLLGEYRKRPDGDTEKYFRERSRLNSVRAGAANDKLLADGLIEPCQVTKNKRPYDGFKLSATPAGPTGTHRDTTGTDLACPDGSTKRDKSPIGGCPGPAHRDSLNTPSEVETEISPVDFDLVDRMFGGRPA